VEIDRRRGGRRTAEHRDRHRGGVDAAAFLVRGNTLPAVAAGLEKEQRCDRALDLEAREAFAPGQETRGAGGRARATVQGKGKGSRPSALLLVAVIAIGGRWVAL
jgi:hypothetical protein